jgi:hypothetical protein
MAATERARRALEKINQKKLANNPVSNSNFESEINQRLANLESAISKDDLEGRDYMQLAREHKLKYGGSLVDAMRWVDQTYPHKRREFLRKHNPHISWEK